MLFSSSSKMNKREYNKMEIQKKFKITWKWLKKKNLIKIWKMKKLKEESFRKFNLEFKLYKLIVEKNRKPMMMKI